MLHVLIVGIGGFLGSIARYWLSGVAQRASGGDFPLGTFLVNALGCFAIGMVMYLVEYRQLIGPEWRVFVTVGILGGFTTFSTFGYETFALLRENEYFPALANVVANVVVGLVAVTMGWMVMKVSGV